MKTTSQAARDSALIAVGEAHLLDSVGAITEIVRWIPLAEAQRRIASGDSTVYPHFFAHNLRRP